MKTKSNSVGILGYGDVGKAIADICKEAGYNVYIRDLERDQLPDKQIDYLHITIPEKSASEFIKTSVGVIKEFSPKLTIIHSSITPGTTKCIHEKVNLPMAYSPIIGVHTHLKDSIRNYFPKMVAPADAVSKYEAARHLKSMGLKVIMFDNPSDLEAAKLLDLIYYGWNILYCKWTKKFCDDMGLDFNNVYTKYNRIYNQGYEKLMPDVVRPVLIPRKGPLGGHCLIPDTKLIHDIYQSELTEYILHQNEKFKKEVDNENKERSNFIKIRDKKMLKTRNVTHCFKGATFNGVKIEN